MITVVVPVFLLLFIILCKKIPKIGGNINIALFIAGIASLLMGEIYSPIEWAQAWISGIDKIAWVICLSIFGSIYSESQVKLGTLDTVMRCLKAKFGHSPRSLVVCIIIALVIAGSLLGDAIAASTVIGVLTVVTLSQIGMAPEVICFTIVMGASLGSIMPPISQALFMSSALLGIDTDPVIKIAFVTVGIGVLLSCIYVTTFFVNKNAVLVNLDENGNEIKGEKASTILKENWTSLIPLMILVFIVIFRTVEIPTIKVDIIPLVLNQITIQQKPFLEFLGEIPILKGLSNVIVLAIIVVTIVSFCFPKVYKDGKNTLKMGLINVKSSVMIQVFAAFMLGAFYAGGQIEAVQIFAQSLNENLLKLGGGFALMIIGMLTGSQATAQNVIFSFFGPALVSIGVNPVHAAIAGSHLAAGGMGLPPADLTTFCVAGIVGGMLKQKVDPVKSMIYMAPMCLYLSAVGILFMYI